MEQVLRFGYLRRDSILDSERYGIDGVANAIESRVQSAGGQVKSDNAVDHALRLQSEISFSSKRNAWRYSQLETAGKIEAEAVVQQLRHLAEEISEQTELRVSFRQDEPGHCVLTIGETRLLLESYRPSLSESPTFVLHIWILDGGRYMGPFAIEDATKVEEGRYEADLDLSERVGWILDGRFLTSLQVADFWLKRELGLIREKNKRRK